MTESLVSPEKPITIAGQVYTLDGSFRTLKAIQHGFDKDIVDVQIDVYRGMRFDDMAKLITIGIGEKAPAVEVIEKDIIEEIGITETRHLLTEWLIIALTPKRDREKKAQEVAKALAVLKKPASRGKTTSNLPLEP